MSKNENRLNFRMTDETAAKIERWHQEDNCRSKNEFIEKAVNCYADIFYENSLPQSNPGGIQIDRKRLEQLQEKREAHGLKGNVYEEYKGPTMSM